MPVWSFSWPAVRRLAIFLALLGIALAVLTREKEAVPALWSRPVGAIARVPTEERLVALTFDVSWGERVFPRILDAIQRADVRAATLFVTGEWARTHADAVRDAQAAGLELGTMGATHRSLSRLPDDALAAEIAAGAEALKAITGRKPTLFRPPNGDVDRRVLEAADRLELITILWDVDPSDWKTPSAPTIAERVLQAARPGSIVLLHGSDAAAATPEALPLIARGLRQRGFALVTVSDLIRGVHVQVKRVD